MSDNPLVIAHRAARQADAAGKFIGTVVQVSGNEVEVRKEGEPSSRGLCLGSVDVIANAAPGDDVLCVEVSESIVVAICIIQPV